MDPPPLSFKNLKKEEIVTIGGAPAIIIGFGSPPHSPSHPFTPPSSPPLKKRKAVRRVLFEEFQSRGYYNDKGEWNYQDPFRNYSFTEKDHHERVTATALKLETGLFQ